MSYIRDGAEIYRRSFATIRAEADLERFDPILERVVVRMIHACGMVDLAAEIDASPAFATRAEQALLAGAPILCDTQMVASGITRTRLPAGNTVVCTLSEPGVPELAARLQQSGVLTKTTTPEQLRELTKVEVETIGPLVKSLGMAPN